jgi:hypothetical protein
MMVCYADLGMLRVYGGEISGRHPLTAICPPSRRIHKKIPAQGGENKL